MTWNIVPEWIAFLLLFILVAYSRQEVYVNTVRDRMFRAVSYIVLLSIVFSLASTYAIYEYSALPHWVVMLITTLYFVLTPLPAMVYFYYTVGILYYDYSFEKLSRRWYFFAVPYVIYVAAVAANWWQGFVFTIEDGIGYVQQDYVKLPYLVFYFYCLAIIFYSIKTRKKVEKRVTTVITVFPLFAFFLVVFQIFYPDVILTGTAAFISLFIVYLYLQSYKITADELTGLLNRNTLFQIINRLTKSSRPFTFVVISLKNFKGINTALGTQTGDLILRQIGQYLSQNISKAQTYRYSGDEYALLIKGAHGDGTLEVLEKIKERFKESWQIDKFEYIIDCRFAVVTYPDAGRNGSDLINSMDYTLSYGKKHDEQKVFFYDKKISDEIKRKKDISDILKRAVKNDGFEVHFQPVWSETDGRFTEAEALLRLKPTELGPVYPDEFIPIAEETGQIVDITYLVLDKICRMISRMDREEGLKMPLGCISINFPFIQFLQPGLKEEVMNIMGSQGVSPERIKVEVTERTLISDVEAVSQFMEEMSPKGVRFALDDFGIEYSNLEIILRLPFNVIKLDKSLVWLTMDDNRKFIFLKNLVMGFKSLDMQVIAEGVETQEQREHVISCGCGKIQGFYFAKPMNGDALLDFLKENEKNS